MKVTGIKMGEGIIAVGYNNGDVCIYDPETKEAIRRLSGHQDRVAALSFIGDQLVTGSKDNSILVHDLRERNHIVKGFKKHRGEVVTLKTKNRFDNIFASGSNDGTAIIWDMQYGFINRLEGHNGGAVKALDWCPWRNGMLATGGGKFDHINIKLWNTNSCKPVTSQPIYSKISSIIWNEEFHMMVSACAEPENVISMWTLEDDSKAITLKHQRTIQGHEDRILNMVQSNDHKFLCTAGADERLKVWSLCEEEGDPFTPTQSSRESSPWRV